MKRKGFADVLIIVVVLVAVGVGFWWFKNQGTQEVAQQTGGLETKKPVDSRFKELLEHKIDKPQFETVEDAARYLSDPDIIFVLTYKNDTRVYPQRILNWHGTVNDEIGNMPIVITFSPLSGASSAFEKTSDGQMKQLPLDAMLWSDFKIMFPNAKVLSRDTGFDVDYNTLPASPDASLGGPQLPVVPDSTFVWGVELNGKFKAFKEEELKEKGYIKDNLGGIPIDIYYFKGDILVRNLKTKEEIVATRMFLFAWKEIHPESEVK